MISVSTKPEVHLEKGSIGVIPCKVDTVDDIAGVEWSKTSLDNDALVILANIDGQWQEGGPGYDQGSYNMALNFSLIINDVGIEDNELFFCRVTPSSFTTKVTNQTNVYVFGKFISFYCYNNSLWFREKIIIKEDQLSVMPLYNNGTFVIQGGQERMQHLRSIISRKLGTE